MGLDMMLYKNTYIGAQYKLNKVKGKIALTKNGQPVKINLKRLSSIREEVGYWRKANQIHRWFIDNCADGEDDCKPIYVTKENIEDLLNLCKQVKQKPNEAEDLLPSQEGFFFGDTEYSEWYYEQIDETIKILESVLAEHNDYSEYEYRASW